MRLTCNIDSRGRLVRLVYGVALLVVGVALMIAWAIPDGTLWPWAATVACLLGGAFAIFEARAGWCAVRAMGFKTPM